MKKFDFYEFAAILAPGAVALTGLAVIFNSLGYFRERLSFSVGDLGIFVILAYVAGHLVQGLGNGVEKAWWTFWGGIPTQWIRNNGHALLSEEQHKNLFRAMRLQLNHVNAHASTDFSEKSRHAITRQVYAAVESAGRAARVDIFSGNYGLARGIAASFILVLFFQLLRHHFQYWQISTALFACFLLALFRMHRFGKHYATELFVQFLQLPGVGNVKEEARK